MPIHALDNDGKIVETGRASKIMAFRGLERVPVDEAQAGDIISIAGLTARDRRRTRSPTPTVTEPLHAQPIDPPTLSMRFAVNDSPMAGREGTKVTSRMIRDRLFREAEIERRDQGDRGRRPRQLRSRRPRRAPARRADRDDAPRGLRARHQPPARAVRRGRERQARPSRTRPSSSTSTRNIRARSSRR